MDFELTNEQIIEHESIQANTVHLDQRNVYNEAFAIMKRSVELAVGDEEKIKYLLQKMNEILLKLEGERHVTIEGDKSLIISANAETNLKQRSTARSKPRHEK